MNKLVAVSLLALSALSLHAQEVAVTALPSWLQLKIASFQARPAVIPPRSILSVSYESKTAYYVSPACCDIPSELYDETGKLLCYPGGGFAGGDGKCPTFALPQKSVALVWRDARAPKLIEGKPEQKR